jgi:O-antigen ligase
LLFFPISPLGWAYAGMFKNPNDLGMILAILVVGISYFLYVTFLKKSLKLSIALILILTFLVYLIFLTGSRTSLLAVIFMIVIDILVSEFKWLHKLVVLSFFMLVSNIILYVNLPALNIIQRKILLSTYSTTLLTSREGIWREVFKDMSWVGHSKDYFTTYIGIGAHNSFIEVLGLYGPLACLIIVLFFVVVFIEFYFKRMYFTKTYQFAFISVFIVFLALSCCEGMFGSLGRGIQLLFFTILGLMNSMNTRKSPN